MKDIEFEIRDKLYKTLEMAREPKIIIISIKGGERLKRKVMSLLVKAPQNWFAEGQITKYQGIRIIRSPELKEFEVDVY